MEKKSAIKKYFLTDDSLVIKYKGGKKENEKLNKVNLKKLIDILNKQFPFTTEEIINRQDNLYSTIAYISLIITLLEGIIFLNLLISFEVGQMKKFIVCSILSCVCIGLHFIILLVAFILLRILKRKLRCSSDRDRVVSKYFNLFGDDIEVIEVDNLDDIKEEVVMIEVKETTKKVSNNSKKTKKSSKKKSNKKKSTTNKEVKQEEPAKKKAIKVKKEDKDKTPEEKEKELEKKQARKKKAKARKRKAKKSGAGSSKKSKKSKK